MNVKKMSLKFRFKKLFFGGRVLVENTSIHRNPGNRTRNHVYGPTGRDETSATMGNRLFEAIFSDEANCTKLPSSSMVIRI